MLTDFQIKLLEAIEKAHPNIRVVQGISRGDVDDFIRKVKKVNKNAEKSTQ